MNSTQRKYAVERVTAIKDTKIAAINSAHWASKKVITKEERCALLRAGKVKLKATTTEISTHTDVVDAYDFSKYEGYTQKQLDEHQQALATIEQTAAQVRDKIMLGDAEEALKLLADFAA